MMDRLLANGRRCAAAGGGSVRVETMLKVAGGELDEAGVASWPAPRLDPPEG